MFTGMNIIEFGKRFQTNADCLQYLMDIKWGEGFKCDKCGSLQYWKGKQWTNLRFSLQMDGIIRVGRNVIFYRGLVGF
jgi:hypothetical protein